MSGTAILDRIDALLQKTAGVTARDLTYALTKLANADEIPEDWHPLTNPPYFGYLLGRAGGDPDALATPIMGRQPKTFQIALTLVAYNCGATATTQTKRAIEGSLQTCWEEIVQLLQDPNHLDRATTGWWASVRFTDSPIDVRGGDRYTMTGRFTTIYAINHGVL